MYVFHLHFLMSQEDFECGNQERYLSYLSLTYNRHLIYMPILSDGEHTNEDSSVLCPVSICRDIQPYTWHILSTKVNFIMNLNCGNVWLKVVYDIW